MSVRVRFAPSPTGHLHIGGLRTAIFNWLFARRHGGTFLLRIEDTDVKRSLVEYTASIMESLEWTGITPDEPIVVQSERFAEHARLVQQLLDEGKAYKCYCTPDEVAQRVGGVEGERQYDSYCHGALPQDKPYAIRFRLPQRGGTLSFDDLIRGPISFNYEQLDDFIITRSDGVPMYNFVVVVDDAHMRVSHVIRGEEHLVNTPKQILLYRALGFPEPHFAHLPLILAPSGAKLSKRDAAVSVLEYKKAGYLAHGLVNYLLRLGWGHKDQEIFTVEEMVRLFDLDGIGKKGAIFDAAKLNWLNNHYLKQLTTDQLIEQIIEHVEPDFITNTATLTQSQLHALLDLYKERMHTLSELATMIHQIQRPPIAYAFDELAEHATPGMPALLDAYVERLTSMSTWSPAAVTAATKELLQQKGCTMPALAYPVRLALVGTVNAPSLAALVDVFGAAETAKRIILFLRAYQQEGL